MVKRYCRELAAEEGSKLNNFSYCCHSLSAVQVVLHFVEFVTR